MYGMKRLRQISLSLQKRKLTLIVLTFLLLNTVFPQVTIKEKVTISQSDFSRKSIVDDTLELLRKRYNPTPTEKMSAFGYPRPNVISQTQQRSTNPKSFNKFNTISSASCGIVAVINPSEIFYEYGEYDYRTFFAASGSFEISQDAGLAYVFKGGEMLLYPNWVCCIGADDEFMLKINDVEVLDYNLVSYNYQLIDPSNLGIDITSYLHPGTNTFDITAWDIYGFKQWLTPLRIEIKQPAQKLIVEATPSYIQTNERS